MKNLNYDKLVVIKQFSGKICLFPTCDRYHYRNLDSFAVGSNT